MKNILLPTLIVLLIVSAVFALSRSGSQAPSVVGGTPAPTNSLTGGSGSPTGTVTTRRFEVTGRNFSFSPNEISVKRGDSVEIVFSNDQGFHDLVIDGYGQATSQIQEGQSETITFVADRVGTYEIYCSVGDHRTRGMVGTFTVAE